MKINKIIKCAAVIAGLASITMIVALTMYLRENKSGHTGISPYIALVVFTPSFALGIANIIENQNPWKNPWTGIIPALTGAFGAGFLIYLDKANVLLEYDTWIRRGMQ
ncbi:MAG TPA: hypothetical protein VI298_10990 [Geobacteraceae bacterium]